jgi:hypothetical protein
VSQPVEKATQNSQPEEKLYEAFLNAEVQEGRRGRVLKPHRIGLSILVALSLGWLLMDTVDELKYHFSGQKVTDLGGAVSVLSEKDLPLEKFVRVQGILGNKAATISGMRPGSLRRGPVQVRHLLGTPIYVEFDQDVHLKEYGQFTQVMIEGRLADFGKKSELTSVRAYFWNRFRIEVPENARLLIADERPGEMWRYPVGFAFGILVALMSFAFLVKSMRIRVLPDE